MRKEAEILLPSEVVSKLVHSQEMDFLQTIENKTQSGGKTLKSGCKKTCLNCGDNRQQKCADDDCQILFRKRGP
jgi:biotin synthase-related radical SAM superfamily protein